MKICRTLDNFKSAGTAVTIGKFDGVHIGHRKLIEVMLKEKQDLESCVFTFDIKSDTDIMDPKNRICTEEEKENIFESLGIDAVILYPFNKTTAAVSAEDFVESILVGKLNCRLLVVGDNFRFGKDRLGDTKLLQKLSVKYGFRLIVIGREEFEGQPVSSSRIREEIKNKNYDKASAMLGK